MQGSDSIVFVVDDDPLVRVSIGDLLESAGLKTVVLGSVNDYVEYHRPDVPGCIVLDIELPDVNGLAFHEQIADQDHPPVVFITGHGDVPSSVKAMKRGAVDFLLKPFTDTELFSAVEAGIAQDRQRREKREELQTLQRRLSKLTPREREVLPLIVSGLLNKQVAAELGIREVTVQVHRTRVMQKMRAASLADLVRYAATLEIPITYSRHVGAI